MTGKFLMTVFIKVQQITFKGYLGACPAVEGISLSA
jgi:hypothetical protein